MIPPTIPAAIMVPPTTVPLFTPVVTFAAEPVATLVMIAPWGIVALRTPPAVDRVVKPVAFRAAASASGSATTNPSQMEDGMGIAN